MTMFKRRTTNGPTTTMAALLLLLSLLLSSGLQLDMGARALSLTPSSIPGAGILESLSGVLFNTVNNLLESTTQPLNEPFLELSEECRANSSHCLNDDPDASRSVSEIIQARGFQVEELDVITQDGYVLMMHRIVNPLVTQAERAKLKPVILQHGLMTSSVDWVINSIGVRPKRPPSLSNSGGGGGGGDGLLAERKRIERTINADLRAPLPDELLANGLGFYLANAGYDVFLANSRGNVHSQRHVNLSAWSPDFWDFTFDQLSRYDLPANVGHVQSLKGKHKKVAYIGHSQGTAIMFGLLSERPEYADVFEPIIMLAPVAFVGNVVSPARSFALYTPIFQHVNMRFGSSSAAVRYLAPLVCGPQAIRKGLCTNLIFLSSGFNENEFNSTRLPAYLAHLPAGTSVKNLAHYGQEVNSGRFAHFDHGHHKNLALYGQAQAPDYQLSRIRSRSLVFFTADNDWLATPKDVAKLRSSLKVKPYKTFNVSEWMPEWNHVDFMYGIDSGRLINTRVLQVLREFDGPPPSQQQQQQQQLDGDNRSKRARRRSMATG